MIESYTLHCLASRAQVYIQRLKREGYWWLLGRVLKKAVLPAAWLLLLPLTIALHIAGLRRLTVFTDRIGHLAAEVDCFLKELKLGKLPSRRWFILAPPNRIANRCLLEYWSRHITIITSPLLCGLLAAMSPRWFMVYDISRYVLRTTSADYYSICSEWGARPALLKLTDDDSAYGWGILESLGVPRGAWFICVHAREPGFSPVDEVLHAHRNSDIARLIPAMEFITGHGGWCVRMGDPTMKRLPSMRNVIDYAHHPARSPRMDVFLCAACRFFLGNSSGIFIVSSVFGVPSALANMIPSSALGYAPADISILKLLKRRGEEGYLRFREVLGSNIARYRDAGQYAAAEIEFEENSAADILEMVREIRDLTEGRKTHEEEDEVLQRRFRSLLAADHYSRNAGSRIGAAFLRKYRRLLD